MADAILALGDVVFGTTGASMSKLKRSRKWRWPRQDVVGAAPRPSFTGPGERTITIDGVVYPGQLGDADALERLVELGDLGEPLALVDSSGRSFGRWTIESVDEDLDAFVAGGDARKIAWTMSLGWFPDD